MEIIVILIIIFYLFPLITKKMQSMNNNRNVIHVSDNPLTTFLKNIFMSNTTATSTSSKKIFKKTTKFIIIGIIAFVLIIKAIAVVPAGHTGVIDFFGTVREKEVSSGIHLINPLANLIKMSIRTEEYTMSMTKNEGQRKNADAIKALTNEGLTVDLDITVFYKLEESKASDVYRNLGLSYPEKIIRPEVRSAIRDIIAQYDAKAVYSEKRQEVAQMIQDKLVETVGPRGVIVEQVLMRNVTLPDKLSDSIQQKLQAEQESQRYDFLLEKEEKEADRKRIEAEGQRDAQRVINESLSPAYLQYLYINELKDREGTIYVPTDTSNGLPIFRGIK